MTDIENVIKAYECCKRPYDRKCHECPYKDDCCHDGMPTFGIRDALSVLKEQKTVAVYPEPSCEIEFITDCCCSLCGAQLIRYDNFCRCCGRPVNWE